MESIMSKTATRHNAEAIPEGRELRDDELKHVSGGGKRADGTSGGTVTGGWDLIANKVHA
jgi:bacteriocin-like protein